MPKKAPVPVPPELLAHMYSEMSDEVWAKTLNYAEKVSGMLFSMEGIVDPSFAEHLVGDAFCDTAQGKRVWDPSKRHLYSHLCGVVQSKVAHHVKHQSRFRHLAYHEPEGGDDETSAVNAVEIEMSLRTADHRKRPDGAVTNAELREKTYAAARVLAKKDDQMLAMLSAHESGALSEPEVIEHLGWTSEHYFNVWRRFDRMRRKLPAELREAARELLTRGPVTAQNDNDE
jgi:hypothetical protein